MERLLIEFTHQLREAMSIAEAIDIDENIVSSTILNITICGMGGSGIGADITKTIVDNNQVAIPLTICKTDSLPAYVNENSLVILSSYSGNTYETISCLLKAIDKKAFIICISSGGQMLHIANSKGLKCIEIPSGNPPRASIGYSLIANLYILYKLGYISDGFKKELNDSVYFLDEQLKDIQQLAYTIAKKIYAKTPILYATDLMQSIVLRWKQQLNENAKMLSWHNIIPEMNHNELVGWRGDYRQFDVLMIRSSFDSIQNAERLDFTKGVVASCGAGLYEIKSKGDTLIKQILYLIALGDWVSLYVGSLRKHDVVEVDIINKLKASLKHSIHRDI